MPLLLGIDTGGTYTDAVLYDEDRAQPIVAKAKALTTYHDLSIGVAGAVDNVLASAAADAGEIALASISTTLATNALVEGRGGRICLVFIGFAEADLQRAGLARALGDDPVIHVAGGHAATGELHAPLDLAALEATLPGVAAQVEGFAVVARFGVRNPEHELAARAAIRGLCDLPVTCGHELAAGLNGPKRALTCVLNARLIGMIAELIAAVEQALAARGVDAPLMLVRGDGSLVSVEFARARPIETILSGPAASLVGAAALTGEADAIVSDIGGTTTDIAVIRDGMPALSSDGAMVGGHETMVEAVRMITHGLGGDSDVQLDETSFVARLLIGPRRALPICRLAAEHAELVQAALDRQLSAPAARELDGRFALARRGGDARLDGLGDAEREIYDAVRAGPRPLDQIIERKRQTAALERLANRGLVLISAFTPTDAAHVLGEQSDWRREASEQAARLFARKIDRRGRKVAENAAQFARLCLDALVRRSAEALLDVALAQDGAPGARSASDALIRMALDRRASAARVDIGVALPVIGLGASARLYYPRVAELLGARSAVPEHADVANAIGAVAGRVEIRREMKIAQPSPGVFRLHAIDGPRDFQNLAEARAVGEAALRAVAAREAKSAGADQVEIAIQFVETAATVEGAAMFIEGALRARASGRPSLRRD